MVKIGFSGTKKGMTPVQLDYLTKILKKIHSVYRIDEFHHSDWIGADEEAHRIVQKITNQCKRKIVSQIHIHPCRAIHGRARCQADELHELKEEDESNKDIVKSTDFLIAAPRETRTKTYKKHSRVSQMINYAVSLGKKVLVIDGYGSIKIYNSKNEV